MRTEGKPRGAVNGGRCVNHRSRRIHNRGRGIDHRRGSVGYDGSRSINHGCGRIDDRCRSVDHRRGRGRRRRINDDRCRHRNKPATRMMGSTPVTMPPTGPASGARRNPDSDAPSPASDANAPGDVAGVEGGGDRGRPRNERGRNNKGFVHAVGPKEGPQCHRTRRMVVYSEWAPRRASNRLWMSPKPPLLKTHTTSPGRAPEPTWSTMDSTVGK